MFWTDDLNDLLPYKTRYGAFAAFCSNPTYEEKKLMQVLDELDEAIDAYYDIGTAEAYAEADILEEVKDLYYDEINKSLETYNKTKEWAQESYDEMFSMTPVVTGNLRNSIMFLGSGPMDIDVKLNVKELVKDKGKMKNVEPYVYSYPDYVNGDERLRSVGTVKLQRGGGEGKWKNYDYSDVANSNARPWHWWEGGWDSLRGFKTRIWELDIKKKIADKKGLVYVPDLPDDYDEEEGV